MHSRRTSHLQIDRPMDVDAESSELTAVWPVESRPELTDWFWGTPAGRNKKNVFKLTWALSTSEF